MRKIILGAALALVASSALAADISAPPVYVSAPGYNWTGFYVGAHGGYGWGNTQDVTNTGAARRDLTGGFGGVQGGYNWQLGSTPFVIGIETDISFGSISSSWGGTNQFDPYYGKDSATMFGTVRGRIGYAFDRVLVYGTGGLAWGEQEHGFGCDAARVAVTNGCQKKVGGKAFYVSKSPIDVGYTVGGGVEYALTRNWTVKAEYLFTDYGTNRIDLVDPNYPAAKTARNFDTTIHTTKLGVNYRF